LDEGRAYNPTLEPDLRRRLLADAMDANDQLIARLDDTRSGATEFRDERVAKAERLRARAAEFDEEIGPQHGSVGSR
jgi:hypothetical protein